MRIESRGTSMLPAIPPGSILEMVAVDTSGIQEGDVIGYLDSAGQTVAHRVIAVAGTVDGDVFVTRGDFQKGDTKVPAHAVSGRVVRISTKWGAYEPNDALGRLFSRLAGSRMITWRMARRGVSGVLKVGMVLWRAVGALNGNASGVGGRCFF